MMFREFWPQHISNVYFSVFQKCPGISNHLLLYISIVNEYYHFVANYISKYILHVSKVTSLEIVILIKGWSIMWHLTFILFVHKPAVNKQHQWSSPAYCSWCIRRRIVSNQVSVLHWEHSGHQHWRGCILSKCSSRGFGEHLYPLLLKQT